MSTSPLIPKLTKGAIVAVDLAKMGRQTIISFQYNPQTLTRDLTPQFAEQDATGQVRFTKAPQETFTLEITLDAADQLERNDSQARELGILPQLAALEILVYPAVQDVIETELLLKLGNVEIGQTRYDAPMTLFVWGTNRVVPVKITGFTITEELFDADLNPICAKMNIKLSALSYSDLDPSHRGYKLFLAYQTNKERLALKGTMASAGQAAAAIAS